MSYNPSQLLNQSMGMLNPALIKPKADAAPVAPPPFDPGIYHNAYARLGALTINNVAELGCGAGNFVSVMVTRGMRPEMYTGIDSNHKEVSVAKAAYPGWKFIYGDFTDLRIRAEYERFGAYLMLHLVDTLDDDLGFLSTLPPEKALVFSIPNFPRPGSLRFMTDNTAIREYYSSILRIQTIGRYKNTEGESWSMIVAHRW